MSGWKFTVAALVAVALAGCDECGKVHQSVFIDAPDPAVQALVDSCRAGRLLNAVPCSPTTPSFMPAKPCACLPLCQRVLELIDQFPGSETLTDCELMQLQVDGGAAPSVRVDVTYRPSTCD
jgi:hypothetical protein